MSADRAAVESGQDSPRKHRRLKLIESYGAFSDERLQEVTEKIRGITSRQPILPSDDAAHPSGDPIGDPIDVSIGDPIGLQIGAAIESPIQTSIEPPDRLPI